MPSLRRAALLAWVLVTLLVGLTWCWAAARSVQAQFETGARILHRVLSQRSEQQEAVLASLDALTRAGVGRRALGQYTDAMRAQYPQIVGVQRCRGRCTAIGPSGAHLPGGPLVPDRAGLQWHPSVPTVYALARGDLRVWVDGRRLARAEDFTDPTSAFQLRRPDGGAVLVRQDLRRPVGRMDAALPVLRVRKVLGSAAQPLVFEGAHPLRWSDLPLWGAALFAVGSALAGAGLVRLIEGRERARAEVRHAERALHDERARAERAFHAVSEALVVTDADHRVRLANPAARALLGGALTPGADLRDAARFRATLGQRPFDAATFWHSPTGADLPEGVTLVTGDGARRVEGALAPVGGDAGWVLVLRDVGPLRARVLATLEEGERRVRAHEEMLAHVTRLSTLGEMSAGLAHELNQPLTAIVSHGQAALRLLADPAADGGRARRSVEAVVTQAKRAAGIITHLRGLVKRTPTAALVVDVHQAVENVVTLVAHDAGRQDVTLDARLSRAPLLVRADPVHLEQVLLNLVRNAVEAVKDAPERTVRVTSAVQAGAAVVEVLDTGAGLSDDVMARLFTPFTTTKAAGLGLGLSLSHTLTQGMGGELRGENRPGGGARFTVTLPLAVEAPIHA
ncbi:ATP-binding protein [Deinococcus sonorensis]|uniref:histidine kinase n=2 Tax=Deinococcus sonorensis TaxID=309891 RepID=A0AAU7U688_9DEIO